MIVNDKPMPMSMQPGELNWQQFSRAFLDASLDSIVVTDVSSKALISNTNAQKHFDIYPGTSIDATLPELSDGSSTTLQTLEPVTGIEITKDNKNFLARISPVKRGERTLGLLYLFQDTTELETISTRMRAFQEISIELESIIDSSNDGIWICDGQGKVVRVNPASEKMNMVKAKDIVGTSMQEMIDKGMIDQSVTLKVIESQKKESIIQHNRYGKRLLLTGTPVFDKQGNLFRVVVNERDITEIETLKQELVEQQALKDVFKGDLLEMQLETLQSKKVIAKSLNFKRILEKAAKIGRADSTVLILGESGTGKGVIAEMIHNYSKRRDKPMIKLNCGTIPDSLVESELFGYAKGAFTGAGRAKPGRFEMADKGILFLDEIGELPLSSQVKLLRFLEDGNLSRIGDTHSKKMDIRIIAATNQNLETMVAEKKFRGDLYYRLEVIPITLPPLRHRKECILPMINHHIEFFSEKHGYKGPLSLTGRAADALENYPYPGNVRELINICERLVVMNENATIDCDDLPRGVVESSKEDTSIGKLWEKDLTFHEMIQAVEKEILKNAMSEHRTQSNAARKLNLNQSTIARKLKKYRLL